MILANDHVHPFDLPQDWPIFDDVLVGCQDNLITSGPQLILEVPTDCRRAFVGEQRYRWCPFKEFSSPICNGRQRNNDEVRAGDLFSLNEECDKRNCLDGFSETLTLLLAGYTLQHREPTISSARMPFK
jgi:hypothetical protein